MKLLLDLGAEVDANNAEGHTALHIAALNDARKTAEVLIHAGAGTEDRDHKDCMPLHHPLGRGLSRLWICCPSLGQQLRDETAKGERLC